MVRIVVEGERRVELAHQLEAADGRRAVGADDDAVRPVEIGDRRAFLEELGVRDDGEIGLAEADALRPASAAKPRFTSSAVMAAATRSPVPTGDGRTCRRRP